MSNFYFSLYTSFWNKKNVSNRLKRVKRYNFAWGTAKHKPISALSFSVLRIPFEETHEGMKVNSDVN